MSESPAILVVDDDLDTCRNLSDILGDLGYTVDTVIDPREALDLVQKKHYAVALLDLKMPGMTGLELYREIRRHRPGTEAIIVTAYASRETEESALQSGARRVLPKPVDLTELLRLISAAADGPLALVVDDDQDLCANLEDVLREQGYRVYLAHDESDASTHLKDIAFQVVLIDLRLPGGDGTTLFRKVRQCNPQARTIVITGYQGELEQRVQQLLDEGADAVCYKPFEMTELLATLQRLTR